MLFGLLKQCPRLESLIVESIPQDQVPTLSQYPPPPVTVPLLRKLTAPLCLAHILAPNRPISELIVRDGPADWVGLGLMPIAQTSTPLRSLALPRTFPTLDCIAVIAALFPDLRKLSIDIPSGVRMHSCGGPWHKEEDLRSPELCDDTAFNELPAEELSDTEGDTKCEVVLVKHAAQPPVRRFNLPCAPALRQILPPICSGDIPVPASLEVFNLRLLGFDELFRLFNLQLEEQHWMVAALRQRYPALREMTLGHDINNWQKKGGLWKRWGIEAYIQVYHEGPNDS
ncbi:hypothetical protein DFH09DRAFT_1322754 [Mycena vulgaris]|nr:hypothetical protein DFH09DRAFT_1322754 [Mycena vulgaris]